MQRTPAHQLSATNNLTESYNLQKNKNLQKTSITEKTKHHSYCGGDLPTLPLLCIPRIGTNYVHKINSTRGDGSVCVSSSAMNLTAEDDKASSACK